MRRLSACCSSSLVVLAGLGLARARAEPTLQETKRDPKRETPQELAPELTLDQALTLASKANRSLLVERARLAQAETNLEMAWASLFPTLVAQGKYTRNNIDFKFQTGPSASLTVQPKNQLDGAISFSMPLIAPSAYLALKAVESSVDASAAQFAASRNTILFGVAQAFYAAAIADEVTSARQSSIEVARATLQNAEIRFQNGNVTRVDVDRAELALVRAEQQAREARFAQEQAYRALATLMQSERSFKVRAAPTAPMQDPVSLELALRLRPEFRVFELGTKSAQAQRRAYAWRWAPTLSAFGSLRAFNYDNFAREQHAWAVGVALDWVLYDGGARDAQRHLAAAQAEEVANRSAVLRDAVADDLANGQGLLETKREAQRAAERSVALAIETLALVRTQYAAGGVAQLDLLHAQDGLVAAQETLARAHFEVAVADLSLRQVAGTFPGAIGKE